MINPYLYYLGPDGYIKSWQNVKNTTIIMAILDGLRDDYFPDVTATFKSKDGLHKDLRQIWFSDTDDCFYFRLVCLLDLLTAFFNLFYIVDRPWTEIQTDPQILHSP